MADQAKEWSTRSNDAVRVRLRHPLGPARDVGFQPNYTYPIFGDEEVIYGYQKLQITLDFQADTLQADLHIDWREKISEVGDIKADDVEDKLKDFLPTVLGDYKSENSERGKNESEPFIPPGTLIHTYQVNGRKYGIWVANLSDPVAKRILRRMQIFVTFNIEGGSFIELDDPDWTIQRWTVYFLYCIETNPETSAAQIYTLAGYSTAYHLFFLDSTQRNSYLLTPPSTSDSSHQQESPANELTTTSETLLSKAFAPPIPELWSTLPSRSRISQFIILPPYQRQNHGSHLYTTMLIHALRDSHIREITVEDPNESFDDLRDLNDLLYLRAHFPTFRSLALNTSPQLPLNRHERAEAPLPMTQLLDHAALDRIHDAARLCRRQFERCVEMQTLANIPPLHRSITRTTRKDKASDPHDRAYYFWRLMAKHRLAIHNAELLSQLSDEERIEKLEQTVGTVEVGHTKVLEKAEGRVAVVVGVEDGPRENGAGSKRAAEELPARVKKRKKVVLVDEDE